MCVWICFGVLVYFRLTLYQADTNLLLLSDGSPVCANCYNCKICDLPILDEAVMTGDDSYHAACFTCRSCRNRIDELVFAKTSQGFYCMKCHNERVARSRRHAAKQKQRERNAMGRRISPVGREQVCQQRARAQGENIPRRRVFLSIIDTPPNHEN